MHNKTKEKTSRRVFFTSLILGATTLLVVSVLGYQFVNKADACEASAPSGAKAAESQVATEQEAPEGASCNLGAQDTERSMALMTKLAQEKLSLVDTSITARFTELSAQDIEHLEAFVEQESSCCSFLTIDLTVNGTNASLRGATNKGQGAQELQMFRQVLNDASKQQL